MDCFTSLFVRKPADKEGQKESVGRDAQTVSQPQCTLTHTQQHTVSDMHIYKFYSLCVQQQQQQQR